MHITKNAENYKKKLATPLLALLFLIGSTLPLAVSADHGNNTNNSSGTNPEVTIGFGNVTNDTLVFTMDTSVDVYSYQIRMIWETGAVYCNIEGTGGLSEASNLFVSVLYAGCLATGYYYGAQGEYHIPSGSNGTLTSIYYSSLSSEVCMGNATYAVLDANDELEWRNATVDPNDCLTFTRYETDDGSDVWFVLDETEDESGDQTEDAVLEPNGDVVIGYGNVTNDRMVISVENSVNIHEFRFLLYDAWCGGSFTTTGLASDNGFYITFPQGGEACEVYAFAQGSQGVGSEDYYIPANSDGTLISMSYESNSQDLCIVQASYLDEVGGVWREATLDNNYCLSYTYNGGSNEWELDADQSKVEIDEYGISEHHSVLWAIQNSPSFSTLAEAIEIANLTDAISPENTPQMGWTIFMPTNDAFEAVGFDPEYFETEEDIAPLRDILLYHISFGGPYGLSLSCPYSIDWMPMANGEYEDPNDYSTWNQTVLVENDCQYIVVNGDSTVIDADNRVYGYEYNTDNDQLPYGHPVAQDNGMIQVVDTLLIPLQYRQPDVMFEFGGEFEEEEPPNDEGEDNSVENEEQVNETDTSEVEETNPQEEENSDEEQEQAPEDWECMDGTFINVDLVDDGSLDCPDGSDEYTPVDEEENSEEASEESVIEAVENATEQDLEDNLPAVDEGDEGGNTDTEGNNDAQKVTDAASSQDRFIVIGGLLSFIVLVGILLGTVAISKKEENKFSSVFEEGSVAMDELLSLLGRSKMLKVMHVLNSHGEGIRFTELKANVDTSSTTLSRRIGELEEFGLISRTELPTLPMTVIYRLTDAGLSLMPRVEGMYEWALSTELKDD